MGSHSDEFCQMNQGSVRSLNSYLYDIKLLTLGSVSHKVLRLEIVLAPIHERDVYVLYRYTIANHSLFLKQVFLKAIGCTDRYVNGSGEVVILIAHD